MQLLQSINIMDSSAQTSTQQQRSALRRKKVIVRLVTFIAVFIFCCYREVFISNHLVTSIVNKLNDRSKPLNDSSADKEKKSSTSRKWKHIQVVSNDKPTKISFQLYSPSAHPITHEYNQYMTCRLGNLTSGKGNRARPTGEVRSGEVPNELMRTA